jgi:hypothetical protein
MMSSYIFRNSLRFFKQVEEHIKPNEMLSVIAFSWFSFHLRNEEFLSVNLTEIYFFKQLLSSLIIYIITDKAEHLF